MGRSNKNIKYRENLDRVYENQNIEKFICIIMNDGKKNKACSIVYYALDYLNNNINDEDIKGRSIKEVTIQRFDKIIENVSPLYEIVKRRVGGATYPVPTSVKARRSKRLGMQFLKDAIKKSASRTAREALANELLDAYYQKGIAIDLKSKLKEYVDSNMVYAHHNR